MKSFSFAFVFLLFCGCAMAQKEFFGLMKYAVPDSWSEQKKENIVSYTGKEPETGILMEIRVHSPEAAAAKPDSSFRLAWKNHIGTGLPVPVIRKRFTESGLALAYNIAFPAAVTEKNLQVYKILVTVQSENKMQAFEIIFYEEKEVKLLRNFIDNFCDGIDTIVKPKD